MEEKEIIKELTPSDMIQEAKEMVEKSEKETVDCINILDKDIAHYEVVKSNLINDYVHESQRLLASYELENIVELDENKRVINVENAPKVDSLSISELSSGKFEGIVLGFMSAIIVLISWIYIVSHLLSLKLDSSGIPSLENLNKILLWIGGKNTGGDGSIPIGIIIVLISASIVAYGIYTFYIELQNKNNMVEAKEVAQDVKFYCIKKEDCKKQMKRISEHLNIVIDVMKTASIYLDEQNATLRRIRYVEGDINFNSLHILSQSEVRRTNILLNGIEELILTDMSSKDGTLSSKAEDELEKTIKLHHSYKEKIYS